MKRTDGKLKVDPYPYQAEGIKKGLEWKKLLIGDEPGLGKTIQSIGIVEKANAYPALVICPSSLKINWQREFEKFTDRKALILDNSTKMTWPYLLGHTHEVAIVNYESLRKYFVWDVPSNGFRLKDVVFQPGISIFKSVIIDECHRVKDPSAQQTIFTKGITAGKPYIIMLSGTPVVNRPSDLVAQLSIMGRLNEFGGMSKFMAMYNGGENLDDLSRKLYEKCLIRREKSKVLTQLPEKTRVDLYVDISNPEEYFTAQNDLKEYLRVYKGCSEYEIRKKMRMKALVKFMALRSLSAVGKIGQTVEFVNLLLESGKKVILFCSYRCVVDGLSKCFKKSMRITGSESLVEKQAAVDSFQTGDTNVVICSIKAAGVGLTLTASSTVVFIEFPWTYSDCQQCEDRAHRIGQKDNVTCYYMIGKDTIDGRLYNIIHDKKRVANQIMATNDDIPRDEQYFDELINIL